MREPASTIPLAALESLIASDETAFPAGTPWQRLRVLTRRHSLERRLAAGDDPAASGALALRARQLTTRRLRDRIGRSIDGVLADTARPSRCTAAVLPSRGSVTAARTQLRAISNRLQGPGVVYARGVALADLLVRDGQSPLYDPAGSRATSALAHLTLRALAGND